MATKYEMSKTYQYRKVMKPLLERKRRARINKCLDDLKDLLAEVMQQQNRSADNDDATAKFEKADILELTVQHLRNLKMQRQQRQTQSVGLQQQQSISGHQHSFRYGYIQAANEVSRCLATLPRVNVEFGTKLMTHLGLRLNQLESPSQHDNNELQTTTITAPLSINCTAAPISAFTSSTALPPAMYSPVSSGYASDYESSRHASPAPAAYHHPSSMSNSSNSSSSKGLLQVAAAPVWRPW